MRHRHDRDHIFVCATLVARGANASAADNAVPAWAAP